MKRLLMALVAASMVMSMAACSQGTETGKQDEGTAKQAYTAGTSHRKEPGCAVSQAVAAGKIEQSRYASYLRLYEKASQVKMWEIK